MKFSRRNLALIVFVLGAAQAGWAAAKNFYLHNGAKVLFYGDSITEQRYYPVAIETYVRARFPNLQVKFVDSAVGGARVTGNWACDSEDQSLERDVFPFKPDVITIMLGMNDASYRPFDQSVFDTYANGYRHILQSMESHLPGVKVVLIEPSPWDDVTQNPSYPYNPDNLPGGYNETLLRYCKFVRQLGAEHHLMVVDFNAPMVKLLEEAEKENPSLAAKIIPGRVHPGASGQMAMAQVLLQAWNAPSTVTRVALNAQSGRVAQSVNTTVSSLSASGQNIAWTQTDDSLPYPIMTLHSTKWPQFPPDPFGGYPPDVFWRMPPIEGPDLNPVAQMVARLTHMYQDLDEETLKVAGLSAASYSLKIDGSRIGTFSKEQLAQGINLAQYDTPMMEQADKVLTLVWHRVDVRFYGWRGIQVPLRHNTMPGIQDDVHRILAKLAQWQNTLADEAHTAAQPKPHHYELQTE
jgi:lysophospholipase L1-like esterase